MLIGDEAAKHGGTGENFDLSAEVFRDLAAPLGKRAAFLQEAVSSYRKAGRIAYLRVIQSTASREVMVEDPVGSEPRPMLMFGSNNYLGLATHPYVKEQVIRSIERWGTGIGGPPFLNGYLGQTRALEERLAAEKGQEACLLYSSGFVANLSIASSLVQRRDEVIYDEFSHASFFDGVRLGRLRAKRFVHSDVDDLQAMLDATDRREGRDIYVAVEGVYSMDGDLAPLDRIVPVCRRAGALLIVDDAHGTGVVGPHGKGVGDHFGLASEIDIAMGTFSKTLAVNGGFVCASNPIVEYLRWLSRPYMFSAALPPTTIAAVNAGLDVIEREPELRDRLWANVRYAVEAFNKLPWNFAIAPQSAIIVLPAPEGMDVRQANGLFASHGIFLNPVEFPAVPISQQRFRISMMAIHERSDIDSLVAAVDTVWSAWQAGAVSGGNI